MKSEIKKLRVYSHTQKSNSIQILAWPETKVFKRPGEGMGVLAQSRQPTPTNLEPSISIRGERKPKSARNEISSLISCSGSSFSIYTNN